jgi:hypothetical protein
MEKKNSYYRLGGLQNKSGDKLISKVRRTVKQVDHLIPRPEGRAT